VYITTCIEQSASSEIDTVDGSGRWDMTIQDVTFTGTNAGPGNDGHYCENGHPQQSKPARIQWIEKCSVGPE